MGENLASLMVATPLENADGIDIPLDQIELTLIEMIVAGKTTSNIANELRKSANWVRTRRKDPRIIQMVQNLQMEAVDAAKTTIVQNTYKAAEAIVNLVESGPPAVKLAAAKDILDRIGLKAPDRKQIEATVIVKDMTADERRASIRARLVRLGRDIYQGEVMDVEPILPANRNN